MLDTDDEERERLELQHHIWQAETKKLLELGSYRHGQTLIDLGCGPGYLSRYLAELVGPQGQIIAVDSSPRFLRYLEHAISKSTRNIRTRLADVQTLTLDDASADGVIIRWTLIFVTDAQSVITAASRALKPGGTLCSLEYLNYSAMTVVPGNVVCDKVFRAIYETWRDSGLDLDIGKRVPQMMSEAGLEIVEIFPASKIGRPGTALWKSMTTFFRQILPKIVAAGHLSEADRTAFVEMWSSYEKEDFTFFTTASVIGVIGRKCSRAQS